MVGGDAEASLELVPAPAVRAVGFTGSLAGGRALMDAAAARPDPIPVYAEMGSLNPVFVLPGAAADPGWADAHRADGRGARRLAGRGSLTATVIGAEGDLDLARALLPLLAAAAGRIVWNGVPTGVAVCDATHHGGPWPATSAPATTSVGTAAMARFLRPVALQGVPDELVRAISPE